MASIYWRKGIAWGRHAHKGVERRASLRTRDRKLAQTRLIAWVNKIVGGQFGEREAHTFDDAAVKFIKEHLPNLKKQSARRYVTSIKSLKKSFKGFELEKISSAALNEFVSQRRKDQVPLPPIENAS